MNKKILALCLVFIMSLLITGCQLALEEESESNDGDRLIGVLITREYLDLTDYEKLINDNLDLFNFENNLSGYNNAEKLSNGKDIYLDIDTSKYQNRLYARIDLEKKDIIFEGVEGAAFLSAKFPTPEIEDNYISIHSGIVSDGKISVNVGDEEDILSLEGTIYAVPDFSEQSIFSFYLNPVYQSSDGRIYAKTGSGSSLGGNQSGTNYTHTLEESQTITENGKSKKMTTSVKISLAFELSTEKVAVVEMDGKNSVLARKEYTPDNMPESIKPMSNAEYIIVEEYKLKHNPDGEFEVFRSLYDKTSDTIETFYCRDDGFCVKKQTKIEWKR